MKKIFIWGCIIIFFCLLTGSCSFHQDEVIPNPSGDIITKKREFSNFDHVAMTGVGEVFITQGEEESLTIEADDNIMPYLQAEESSGKLTIGFKEGKSIRFIIPTRQPTIKFTLVVKDLTKLDLSGLGNIKMPSLETSQLDFLLNGAGNVSIDSRKTGHLSVMINGLGNVTLAGEATEQDITINGGGSYHAGDLQSQKATVDASGLGKTTLLSGSGG